MTDVSEVLAGLEEVSPKPVIEPDDRLLPLALECVPQPIFWVDRDARLAGVNAAMLELFGGIARETLVGHRLADVLDDGSRYDEAHAAVMAGDQAMASLAFDRAARMYEMALTLQPEGPNVRALDMRYADALVEIDRLLSRAANTRYRIWRARILTALGDAGDAEKAVLARQAWAELLPGLRNAAPARYWRCRRG